MIVNEKITYQIQTVEKENQGRHRILLHGGVQPAYDAKSIRTLLARYLYKEMRQKPAFIFVYDRPEDLHYPQGFTVARLVLPIDGKKYTVEVRDRSGLEMPTEADFKTFDDWGKEDRKLPVESRGQLYAEFSPESLDKCFAFLYHAPIITFSVSA